MDKIFSMILSASKVRSGNDDDSADRLSSRYSVALLVAFAVLVSMNQYVRNPITCWAPMHFTGPHTRFTTNYCWVKNTYYLPWQEEVPSAKEARQMIPYYQWIPFILLAMATLFYAPALVWRKLNSRSGIDADNILEAAHKLRRCGTSAETEKMSRIISRQLDRFLCSRQDEKGSNKGVACILNALLCRICGRRLNCYLVVLYMASKLLYIGNVLLQFFLLSAVLSKKYSVFGFQMLNQISNANTDDWTEDNYVAFPRVTFCDFAIRGQDLANTQTYTVQCVLPVNMYNEKIFLFLWFWMVLVGLFSIVSFFLWLFRFISPSDKLKFVNNHLQSGQRLLTSKDKEFVDKFVKYYMNYDGALIVRLIAHNTDHLTTSEVICDLWDFWRENNTRTPSTSEGYRPHYPDIELDQVDEFKPLHCKTSNI